MCRKHPSKLLEKRNLDIEKRSTKTILSAENLVQTMLALENKVVVKKVILCRLGRMTAEIILQTIKALLKVNL